MLPSTTPPPICPDRVIWETFFFLPELRWAKLAASDQLSSPRHTQGRHLTIHGVSGIRWKTQAKKNLLKWLGATISVGALLPALNSAAFCCVSWCMCPDLVLTCIVHWSMVHLWYFSTLLTTLFTLVSICSFLLFYVLHCSANFPVMVQPITFADGKLFSFGGIMK